MKYELVRFSKFKDDDNVLIAVNATDEESGKNVHKKYWLTAEERSSLEADESVFPGLVEKAAALAHQELEKLLEKVETPPIIASESFLKNHVIDKSKVEAKLPKEEKGGPKKDP